MVGVVGVSCDPLQSKDELSSPVVDNEVVGEKYCPPEGVCEIPVPGEKYCGGGNSLLCLILHWSSSTCAQ